MNPTKSTPVSDALNERTHVDTPVQTSEKSRSEGSRAIDGRGGLSPEQLRRAQILWDESIEEARKIAQTYNHNFQGERK